MIYKCNETITRKQQDYLARLAELSIEAALGGKNSLSYRDFYKERRREKYIREETQLAGGVISLNAIDNDELDGVGVVLDTSEPLDEKIMRKIMIEKLPEAISILNDEEKELTEIISSDCFGVLSVDLISVSGF